MKKPMVLLGGLTFIVIVLAVARITVVNTISTTGDELVQLENQIADVQRENELLKEQYLQAASYTSISKKAKRLGFAPAKDEINMSSPLPLAKR